MRKQKLPIALELGQKFEKKNSGISIMKCKILNWSLVYEMQKLKLSNQELPIALELGQKFEKKLRDFVYKIQDLELAFGL